jgi:hypothetical protein
MPQPDFDALPVVHNCWAIYTDGTTAVAEFARPQDWGDPRWMYRVYRLSAPSLGHTVIAHCWIEQHLPEHKHLETFAPLIGSILLPGHAPEECGRDYLREEDFWSPAWGQMPPHFEGEAWEDGRD